jgi:hypothetical protein
LALALAVLAVWGGNDAPTGGITARTLVSIIAANKIAVIGFRALFFVLFFIFSFHLLFVIGISKTPLLGTRLMYLPKYQKWANPRASRTF